MLLSCNDYHAVPVVVVSVWLLVNTDSLYLDAVCVDAVGNECFLNCVCTALRKFLVVVCSTSSLVSITLEDNLCILVLFQNLSYVVECNLVVCRNLCRVEFEADSWVDRICGFSRSC